MQNPRSANSPTARREPTWVTGPRWFVEAIKDPGCRGVIRSTGFSSVHHVCYSQCGIIRNSRDFLVITRACWESTALLGTAVYTTLIRQSRDTFPPRSFLFTSYLELIFTPSKGDPSEWWQLNQRTWCQRKWPAVVLRDRFYANHQDIEAFAVCLITAPTYSADAGVFYSFSSEGKYCATLMRRKFNEARLYGDEIPYSAGSSTSSTISAHLIMLSGISAGISLVKHQI